MGESSEIVAVASEGDTAQEQEQVVVKEGGDDPNTTLDTATDSPTPSEEENPPPPKAGTILEAAFVDPAYSWPPKDGEGRNAIELQASTALLTSVRSRDEEDVLSDDDLKSSPSTIIEEPTPPKLSRTKQVTTVETTYSSRCGFFKLCKKAEDQVVHTHTVEEPLGDDEAAIKKQQYEDAKRAAAQRKAEKKLKKKERLKLRKEREEALRRAERDRTKYSRVPEGIFVYRLDTAAKTVTLLSGPSSNTDLDALLRHMVVAAVSPSADKTRRGICLTGVDGTHATLVACEQRTATAWLEAMDMMLGKTSTKKRGLGGANKAWGAHKLNDTERADIEEQYVNLAAYSNQLIRNGALPDEGGDDVDPTTGKKAKNRRADRGGAGSVYYNVSVQRDEDDEDYDEEALESIAKRRAVIKDSWDFYRMICSLLRDRRKYDEAFKRLQSDPVYAYLNSMTGLNDPGEDREASGENVDKEVIQADLPEYSDMTRTEVVRDLVQKAEEALPSLVEICKALAGSLGMEEVGVGPVKEASAAIRKAEKKYRGDVLKVTDYCRALLVVKDFPTLLALLELARDSFGPLIRRVKISTLKADRSAKPGGYRDCIINLELKEHICEIQVHLWPMWVVCGVDGFRHYRHCLEYSTDSFGDPYDALAGLDRKTMAELIVMAEEAVADMPLESLEWYHEKYILDYFAEVGLFLRHDLAQWGEVTLRTLIRLRCESPDIGPDHHETVQLKKYLSQALRQQGKAEEADDIDKDLVELEEQQKREKEQAEQSLWDSVLTNPASAVESMWDPNKKEREEDEKLRKEVKASKKAWRRIREERFKFLDANHDDVPGEAAGRS